MFRMCVWDHVWCVLIVSCGVCVACVWGDVCVCVCVVVCVCVCAAGGCAVSARVVCFVCSVCLVCSLC